MARRRGELILGKHTEPAVDIERCPPCEEERIPVFVGRWTLVHPEVSGEPARSDSLSWS